MKCPYCNHEFPLTWARYVKSPLGRHVCPSCLKQSRLEFGIVSAALLLLVAAAVATPGVLLFYRWFGGYWAVLGALPTFIVIFPLDKMLDGKRRKLRGLDESGKAG